MRREFHPVAAIFPLMDEQDRAALADDIRINGLREAIVLHPDGRILDGRNRYLACDAAGVEAHYRTWDGTGSAVAYVLSLNLHRRHLNESQRSIVAAKIATLRPQDTLKQNATVASIEATTQPDAAEMLNVSRASVQRAREVLDQGTPELVAAVEQGHIPVSLAAKFVKADAETQTAIVEKVVQDDVRPLRWSAGSVLARSTS